MPDGLANAAIPTVYSSFAKSHLILSYSDLLGSENTALGAFFVKETGSPIVLSDSHLSDNLWTLIKTEVLERSTKFFATIATHIQPYEIASLTSSSRFYTAITNISATFLHQTYYATFTASYSGAIFWHDHKHLDRPWSEEEPIVNVL
jgi:hypothetical protein